MGVTSTADAASAITETYDDVRGLLQTASWEVMDEDQRDDVIAKIVVPRWGKVTTDNVELKGTAWAKLLGTTVSTIKQRVARIQAADQGKPDDGGRPAAQPAGQMRSAKASIKKHPELAGALLADPEVAAAATQALIDHGDIKSLSSATAKVAKNRQVERNRKRREKGEPKGRTVDSPRPEVSSDPGVNAFFSVQGLADALRALVTTFPREWAALSDAAREDEDFVGVCEETLDKIDIASASCRALISGGMIEAELQSILDGGA